MACGGGQGGGGGRAVIVGSVNMTNNVDDRVTDVSDYVSAINKYSNQKKGGIFQLPPIEYSGSCILCELGNICIGAACMKLKGKICS